MAINNLVEISQYCLFFEWFTKLQTSIIEKRHQNKNDNLLIKKRLRDRIQQNPNKIIKNLTNVDLINDEISVLELGLKHGQLMRPK